MGTNSYVWDNHILLTEGASPVCSHNNRMVSLVGFEGDLFLGLELLWLKLLYLSSKYLLWLCSTVYAVCLQKQTRDLMTSRIPTTKYCIAGNIGGELNLADWRFWKQTTKLKSPIYSLHVASHCVLHVCEDGSKIYNASLLQKKSPFGLSVKVPIYRWRIPMCKQTNRKCSERKRPRAQTNIVESTTTTHQRRDDHVDAATAKKCQYQFRLSFFAKPPNKIPANISSYTVGNFRQQWWHAGSHKDSALFYQTLG